MERYVGDRTLSANSLTTPPHIPKRICSLPSRARLCDRLKQRRLAVDELFLGTTPVPRLEEQPQYVQYPDL